MDLLEAKNILEESGYFLKDLYESVDDYEGDIYMELEDCLQNRGFDPIRVQNIMADKADYINSLVANGLSADEIAEKLDEDEL